jgi:hypothetical protein
MGLDIAAFSGLTKSMINDPDEVWKIGGTHLYVNEDFPDRADGLKTGGYLYNEFTRFRAGSYSGYNWWRSQLCMMVHGVEPDVLWAGNDKRLFPAFFELIHFSDCEGVIGPKTSAKLYQDFSEWKEKAEQYAAGLGDTLNGQTFIGLYRQWMEAFGLASNNGAVKFC